MIAIYLLLDSCKCIAYYHTELVFYTCTVSISFLSNLTLVYDKCQTPWIWLSLDPSMTAIVTIQTNDYSFRRYQKHTHLRSRYRKTCIKNTHLRSRYRKTCIDDNTYRTLPICDFRLLWSDPHASCYGQENEATASLVAKGTQAFFVLVSHCLAMSKKPWQSRQKLTLDSFNSSIKSNSSQVEKQTLWKKHVLCFLLHSWTD